jgi:hypothetical protein
MADVSHLYLLVFPERGIFKVGKADDIPERVQSLRRWWGEVDYEASYHLTAERDVVFKLEKSLHFLLSEHSVDFAGGDGRTELFSRAALELALKHIELFSSSRASPARLVKGAPKPPARAARSAPSTRRVLGRKCAAVRTRSREMARDIAHVSTQFDRINRWLLVLLRRQGRIAFQYDIIDGHVYFRLHGSARLDDDRLLEILCFRIQDASGRHVLSNDWNGSEADGVVQYKFRLPTVKDHPVLAHLSSQTEAILNMLPRRSTAATEDIPIIDTEALCERLWSGLGESVDNPTGRNR